MSARTASRCATARMGARSAAPTFLLCAAVGCSDAAAPPITDPPPDEPVALPVLGLGPVPGRYTAEVAAVPGWAYTSTWATRGTAPANIVQVWNVQGQEPVLADSLIIPDAPSTVDVHISDDGRLLMVATGFGAGSIVLYDLTDPGSPQLVSRFASPSTAPEVHTAKFGRAGDRLLAFLSVTPTGELVTVDVTDPAQPRQVRTERMADPFPHDVFVRDGILFVAIFGEGIGIWDIGGGDQGGTPEDPVQLSLAEMPIFGVHNVWWFHDPSTGERRYAFVGQERFRGAGTPAEGDVHVLDVSDLTRPEPVAFYSPPVGGAHNFWLDEQNGYLYAAFYNGGVRVLDVRGDLSDCTDAQRASDGRCSLRLMGREVANGVVDRDPFIWGVAKIGSKLFASDMLQGLWVMDASALTR